MILKVLDLTLADEGEYKCVVTNDLGAVVFIFELDVLRKCLVILNTQYCHILLFDEEENSFHHC